MDIVEGAGIFPGLLLGVVNLESAVGRCPVIDSSLGRVNGLDWIGYMVTSERCSHMIHTKLVE